MIIKENFAGMKCGKELMTTIIKKLKTAKNDYCIECKDLKQLLKIIHVYLSIIFVIMFMLITIRFSLTGKILFFVICFMQYSYLHGSH